MTIEELFGTLQQSVVGTWRKHLRTSKYSKHMALDEFYTEMPEKVDALIEAWMGVNGKKPKQFDNILKSKNMNTLDYLKSLKKVVKDGYELMDGEKELEALLDDIAELIDSTLYKVKELNENKIRKPMKNLKEFLNESLVNEDITLVKEYENEAKELASHLGLKPTPKMMKSLTSAIDKIINMTGEEFDVNKFYLDGGQYFNFLRSFDGGSSTSAEAKKLMIVDKQALKYSSAEDYKYDWDNQNGEWLESY